MGCDSMTRLGRFVLLFSALFFIRLLPAASPGEKPLSVTVSVSPQKYFVEKIGGKRFTVEVMVPPGAFPGTYEPGPRQMAALSRSKAFFAVGVPYEKAWLQRFCSANPHMLIVHTEKGIQRHPMSTHLHERESSREEEPGKGETSHVHKSPDPHIWLSPPLVRIQAENIFRALCKIDPVHREEYMKNLANFQKEIDELDKELKELFSGFEEKPGFLVFHPSWGYFARRYGLTQIPIELEGKSPSPRDLVEVIELAGKRGIKVVFVQPQVSPRSAQTVARAIGGTVVPVDPLSPDWGANLKKAAVKIRAALEQGGQS